MLGIGITESLLGMVLGQLMIRSTLGNSTKINSVASANISSTVVVNTATTLERMSWISVMAGARKVASQMTSTKERRSSRKHLKASKGLITNLWSGEAESVAGSLRGLGRR